MRPARLLVVVLALPLPLATLATAAASAQPPAARAGTTHPLPPGIYEIRPQHTDMCLTYVPGAWPRVPYLSQRRCRRDAPDVVPTPQRHEVLPVRGGYAIRVNAADQCATVARRFVIGPSSINVVPCDDGGDRCAASAADQVFRLVFIQAGHGTGADAGGDVYEIRTANGECWAVDGGKRDEGVDAIRWMCTGENSQRFRFRYIAPVADPAARACTGG